MRKFVLFIICALPLAYFQFAVSGCANIIPPLGGPQDTIPPRLVSASPENGTVNFRGNRITLTFDEFVDLQDVVGNLLLTPLPASSPRVEVKLRTITVRLPDSLEANTTYVFNFGNAIRDVNEGNVARNFVYTFSTGPRIDSLELRGKVILAETGTTDSTMVVILHSNLTDSAVVKERPRYIARLNGQGEFHFKNLPPGTFNIYALGDAGMARRYMNKNQAFAFVDRPVTITDTASPVTLYAFKERQTATSITSTSTGTPRTGLGNDKRLRYSMNLNANQLDLLKDLQITFDLKLKYLDSSKIQLASDSTFKREPFRVSLDSTKRVATVNTSWREGTRYHLIVDKDFAEDSIGRKLFKSDTLSFSTRKRSEYGSIVVKLKNYQALKNPVLQLIQNGAVVFSAPFVSGIVRNDLFVPGEYNIRILEDINGNGKWDPGQFLPSRIQPEIARPLDRKFTVRPAFQNEVELSL